MKEEISKLKQMTMKPPIFAERVLSRLECLVMEDRFEGRKPEKDMMAMMNLKMRNRIATELFVDNL